MKKKITKKEAKEELEKGYSKAEKLLKDNEKTELFLQKLEKKLKTIPKLGDALAMVPILISLVRSYIKKEYTEIPLGSIIAVLSALIYILAPVDAIPDAIPAAGLIDDALVITTCYKLVKSDVDEYIIWRKENNKELDV